jgi:hypothetical protein
MVVAVLVMGDEDERRDEGREDGRGAAPRLAEVAPRGGRRRVRVAAHEVGDERRHQRAHRLAERAVGGDEPRGRVEPVLRLRA